MKYAVFALLVFALTGCAPADEQRTRAEAKQTGDAVKRDAKKALDEAKVETQKATKEIDKGLRETRDKVRKALNAPPDSASK